MTKRTLGELERSTVPNAADLLDGAPCGIISFTDDGVIVVANATLGRLLERDANDLIGLPFESILTIPARIFYQTHFFPLIKLHGRAEEIYFTLRAQSGAVVHVLANAVRQVSGETARIDCVLLRIHERQKYEQELLHAKKVAETANSAKMRFLSMVSHDLRTPLGAISGYADLLLLGVRGDINEAQTRDVRRIKEVTGFLLVLLDDILTFARAEAGALTVSVETTPLEGALARAELIVGPQFQRGGVTYARDPSVAGATVRADPDRLQQILLNLLGNAAKFTPSGGTVTVRCTRDDAVMKIQVVDTGRGIPADRLGEIFEPFVQVDRELDAKKQKGMGLGLAISRELARAMKGDLVVESIVGVGSTFTVSLPAPSA